MRPFRPIFNILGLLLFIESVALLIPMFFDLIKQNQDWKQFYFLSCLTFLIGLVLYVGFKKENITTKKYWDLFDKNKKKENYSIVKDKFSDYLKKAINRNLVSDRKLGLSLSGGNDSEVMANQVRKLNRNLETVTYGFKNSNINRIIIFFFIKIRSNYPILDYF